jgi:ORF6N domain
MRSQIATASGKHFMRNQIETITSAIRTVRGQKVLLDEDLARIYGVPTKALNRAVKRNLKRFPDDFMFQLTRSEFENLKYQFGTSSSHGGRRKLPFAFTEKGAIMAANVLNSPDAVRMSVFVVRAFIKMRELLGGTKELARQLADLEKKLTARLDGHEIAIVEVLRRVMDVLDPPPPPPDPPRRRIGFHVEPEDEPKPKRKKKA